METKNTLTSGKVVARPKSGKMFWKPGGMFVKCQFFLKIKKRLEKGFCYEIEAGKIICTQKYHYVKTKKNE